MCTLLYASSGIEAAQGMGFILMAFGLGLIPYSVQYVVLRGFYAYGTTQRTYNTVIVAAVNAAASAVCSSSCLPSGPSWAWPPGPATPSASASPGAAQQAPGRRPGRHPRDADLRRPLHGLRARRDRRRCRRFRPAGTCSAGALGSLVALVIGGAVLLGIFFVAAKRMRIAELNTLVGMVRGRLGR
ncbi:murein biosynthesis integral membrane protein MurJ [Streptomyces tanashiensis]